MNEITNTADQSGADDLVQKIADYVSNNGYPHTRTEDEVRRDIRELMNAAKPVASIIRFKKPTGQPVRLNPLAVKQLTELIMSMSLRVAEQANNINDTYLCKQAESTLAALQAQPSAPASLSAMSVDDLAESIRKIDGCHTMGADGELAEALLPHLSGIVPQVVQAPKKLSDLIVALSMRVAEQSNCNADIDLCREAEAAIADLAAPIVATVPSEPVATVCEPSDPEGIWQTFLTGFVPVGTKLYAAPSPTEQASSSPSDSGDVRNATLEEAAIICDLSCEDDNRQTPSMRAIDIRALKSASAAKGNAPDEVSEAFDQMFSDSNAALKNITIKGDK